LHWELLFSRSLSCFCSQKGAFLQDERVGITVVATSRICSNWSVQHKSRKDIKLERWANISVIQFTQLFKYLS
jgi:hypothetical protein